MLELAILGLLEEQDLHGYELRKRLRSRLGLFANLSFGSLYPALARLEASGALRTIEETPRPAPAPASAREIPLTGSLGGERAVQRSRRSTGGPATRSRRARKVYRITPQGHQTFQKLLTGELPGPDDRDFDLRLTFARHLAPQGRIRLLERRRTELARRLDDARAAQPAPSSRLDIYARSLAEHTREALEHDIAWLDGLLAAEPPGASGPRTGKTTGKTEEITT